MPYYITFAFNLAFGFAILLAPLCSSAIIWRVLKRRTIYTPLWLALAYIWLLITCWFYFLSAQTSTFSASIAVVSGIITGVAAITAGLVFISSSFKYRLFIASSISIVFPLFLTVSIVQGSDRAPRYPFEHESRQLVQAIEAYRNDTGVYPNELNLLIPTYLRTIPVPQSCTDWQYTKQNSGNYQLQCSSYIDEVSYKFAYCEYQARKPE